MGRFLRWLVVGFVLPGAPLGAQNTTWSAEADFNSRYVWRGIAYSQGPVFQPALWVTHRRTTVAVWSNMVLNNEPGRGRFDQVFFTLSREVEAGGWLIEPTLQGYVWQGLQGDGTAKTLEFSAKASRPLGPVRFATSHTVDVASYAGSYIGDAGVEWTRMAHRWQLESAAATAWANRVFNRTYIGPDQGAMNYLQFTVAATRRSAKGWYVRGHAELYVILSDPIRRALGERGLGSGGVTVGREF